MYNGASGPFPSPAEPRPAAIELACPPRLGESPPMAGSAGMILVPAASGVGAVLLAVTHQDRPLLAVAGLLVLAASITVGVIMVVSTRTGARRRTLEQRERYLDYLEQMRFRARDAAARQRSAAGRSHPNPGAAASLAWIPERRWERAGGDPDFLMLRAGIGTVPLAWAPSLPADDPDPLEDYDPVCLAAARDLVGRYAVLADQPVCLPLAPASAICVVGPPSRVRGVMRALLAQLIWSHSPTDVAVLLCSAARSGAFDWLKWLPHAQTDGGFDVPLPARLLAEDAGTALDLLAVLGGGSDLTGAGRRRVIMVIDGLCDDSVADVVPLVTAARAAGAVAVCLVQSREDEPERVDHRVEVGAQLAGQAPDALPDLIESISGVTTPCRLDELDTAGALLLARSFAPLRAAVPVAAVRPTASGPLRFADAAGIDPAITWRRPPGRDVLRVPIGIAQDDVPGNDAHRGTFGAALVLDLKESALGGMGPHGLVVGATGSGKSELLRTLVTALAISHPPTTLALLLADFKGGATFSGLAGLPHVAGMITNLEADLSLVDRFRDALGGELLRRQELLAAAGKLTSLGAYVDLRRRRPELEPMPHLLVVVDEFSELLGARPDLAELFVTIGRIGRSIGVHLLLATQRLDTGRIRGLESHLSYRICLRTFSEPESREAIGGPEAYYLPPEPGSAYLRAGTGLRRFRAATVSRPYRPAPATPAPGTFGEGWAGPPPVLPFTPGNGLAARIMALHGRPIGSVGAPVDADRDRTLLDVVVERLTTGARDLPPGRPVRRIWLDPLPTRLSLSDLLTHNDFGSRDTGLHASGIL